MECRNFYSDQTYIRPRLCASRHHGCPITAPLKSLEHHIIGVPRVLRSALNWDPIIQRDISLSDGPWTQFQSVTFWEHFRNGLDLFIFFVNFFWCMVAQKMIYKKLFFLIISKLSKIFGRLIILHLRKISF